MFDVREQIFLLAKNIIFSGMMNILVKIKSEQPFFIKK